MENNEKFGGIAIVDYGSQYTQLIARRVRELGVYSEILPHNAPVEKILADSPKGIILSGGPRSVTEPTSPKLTGGLLESGIPILGVCYGMQLLAHSLGGRVSRGERAEYGRTRVVLENRAEKTIFDNLPGEFDVWMSHWDQVTALPEGAVQLAESEFGAPAAFSARGGNILAVQFHPEVEYTEHGVDILSSFVFDVCHCDANWKLDDWVQDELKEIKAQIGDEGRIICGLSGGVDSTVAAVLTSKVAGKRLDCIFVDHGFLRKDEAKQVLETYRSLDLQVHFVDASERFLSATAGVTDPEKKRKIIGELFVRVFEEKAKELGGAKWLLQGTIYPDVIESGSAGGETIKTHHNVGGLPEKMDMQLLEPLRDLFKDEVRKIGRVMKIEEHFLSRHPFPGPGLAVRCLGEMTKERLDTLRAADAIFVQEIRDAGLYESMWQAFCALLPVKSVGVAGDVRTYGETVVLRAVQSSDAMTAEWVRLPWELVARVSHRICAEVPHVGRVVLDVTSKPPATIEWE